MRYRQHVGIFVLLCAIGGMTLACGVASRPPLSFVPTTLPIVEAGQPYEATVTIQDYKTDVGDIYLSAGELPPGLVLEYSSGDSAKIIGTPEQTGIFSFTIAAWCFGTNVSGQTGEQTYELVVE